MSDTPAKQGRTDLIEPEQWYAQLATTYAAAGALITDPAGNVLLVKPNYRDHWALPGGMIEHNEPPEDACAREISEELGVCLSIGRLLVIDWAPAFARRPRPITYFLFDGGVLDRGTGITLQYAELDHYSFTDPDRVDVHLDSHTAARIPAALTARANGTTIYLPQNRLDPDSPTPLYQQVAALLRVRIASGELTSRLPSLRTITQEYGVSHITAEKAVQVLRDEELVVTVVGRGTYVKPKDASLPADR